MTSEADIGWYMLGIVVAYLIGFASCMTAYKLIARTERKGKCPG